MIIIIFSNCSVLFRVSSGPLSCKPPMLPTVPEKWKHNSSNYPLKCMCMCVRLKSRHSYAAFLVLEQALMHYILANVSSSVLGESFWTLSNASAWYHVLWNSVKLMTGNQRIHWKSLGMVMRGEIACVSQKSGKQSQDLIISVYVTHHPCSNSI